VQVFLIVQVLSLTRNPNNQLHIAEDRIVLVQTNGQSCCSNSQKLILGDLPKLQ